MYSEYSAGHRRLARSRDSMLTAVDSASGLVWLALSSAFGFHVVVLVVVGVVVIVVVVIAAIGADFVQDDPDHVGPQAFEGGNRAAERLAMRASGYGHYQHTVDRYSHLQRLREAEQRRRIEDHEVVFRAGILQEHRQLRTHQIGSSPGWRTHGQNIQAGKFRRLCQCSPPG